MSVLGPLLFLLCINDIQHCSQLISTVLFVDDSNIRHSHACFKKLNEIIQAEINNIEDWLSAHKKFLEQKAKNLKYYKNFYQ